MTASVGTEEPKALVRALDGRRGTVIVLAMALAAAALTFAFAFASGFNGVRGGAATGRAIAVSVVVGVIAAILAFWLRAAITAPAAEDKRDGTAEGGAFRVTGRARPPASEPGLARRATGAVAALGGAEIAVSGARGAGRERFSREPGLPTFDDVGGMDALKREIAETVGLLLAHPDDADHYGIEWNGLLLHGQPGIGKTFLARAIAGEYGMSFVHVSTADLVSGTFGESARNIARAFEAAMKELPCVLFFDEFDTAAQRRDAVQGEESRRMVNQLLTSLEAYRDERRLVVMAATTDIERLEPAVLRPGRFDRHIRIDLPDAEARRALFQAELAGRPAVTALDLDEVVRRTEGLTPAAIARVVATAALDVFREATATGTRPPLDAAHLVAAVERFGGQDRPTVESWSWETVILPAETKRQLQRIQAVIEDPASARRFGIEPPTGLLMAGPPGTGKTTVAKVLAAQARCSFYGVSGADVMSKWVGEAEANIRRLFDRARENRPSIVFIDEIDALAARRGAVEVNDSRINQLLAEIDGVAGQRGVFVIGATNRPDKIDPALVRGGRLSRTFVLGLPDLEDRRALLELYTSDMPVNGLELGGLARETDGMAPADLKALCQEAALAAMDRSADGEPAVTSADFGEALTRLRAGS